MHSQTLGQYFAPMQSLLGGWGGGHSVIMHRLTRQAGDYRELQRKEDHMGLGPSVAAPPVRCHVTSAPICVPCLMVPVLCMRWIGAAASLIYTVFISLDGVLLTKVNHAHLCSAAAEVRLGEWKQMNVTQAPGQAVYLWVESLEAFVTCLLSWGCPAGSISPFLRPSRHSPWSFIFTLHFHLFGRLFNPKQHTFFFFFEKADSASPWRRICVSQGGSWNLINIHEISCPWLASENLIQGKNGSICWCSLANQVVRRS